MNTTVAGPERVELWRVCCCVCCSTFFDEDTILSVGRDVPTIVASFGTSIRLALRPFMASLVPPPTTTPVDHNITALLSELRTYDPNAYLHRSESGSLDFIRVHGIRLWLSDRQQRPTFGTRDNSPTTTRLELHISTISATLSVAGIDPCEVMVMQSEGKWRYANNFTVKVHLTMEQFRQFCDTFGIDYPQPDDVEKYTRRCATNRSLLAEYVKAVRQTPRASKLN